MELKFFLLLTNGVKDFSASLFGQFKIGTELLIYNGILTFVGLLLISRPQKISPEVQSIIEHANN
jgi:hypothetical protein